MIKVLIFFISFPLGANRIPQAKQHETIFEQNIRWFHHLDDQWLTQVEVENQSPIDSRQFKFIQAGAKYRLGRNLKFGLHLQNAWGLRHDKDWDRREGRWRWNNTNGRSEQRLLLDLGPRALLPFLPGDIWRGDLRLRLQANLRNGQKTFILRPRLVHFFFHEARPQISVFTQVHLEFPLNYTRPNLRDERYYLGGRYHYNQKLSFGLHYFFWRQKRAHTEGFFQDWNDSYEMTETSHVLGLNLQVTTR